MKDRDEREENGDGGDAAADAPAPAVMPASNRPAVLPDGSYATQARSLRCFRPACHAWQHA